MKIAKQYDWLSLMIDAPKMIKEAIKLGKLNTNEIAGPKSNPEILALAKEAGVSDIYKSDELAWCAVVMCVIVLRSGREITFKSWDRLRAISFLKFGVKVKVPMFGDVLVFSRPGGNHVGLYVAEDNECYHVAGGNQSNQFNVTRIKKNRLTEARRPVYVNQPLSVKRIYVDPIGGLSENEA